MLPARTVTRLLQPRAAQLGCAPLRLTAAPQRQLSHARTAVRVGAAEVSMPSSTASDAASVYTVPPRDASPTTPTMPAAAEKVERTRFSVDKPAEADAQRFTLHPSVAYWRDFTTRWTWNDMGGAKGGAPQDTSAVSQLTSLARNVVATSAMQDATSAAYWAYHMGRTAFFVGEGVASLTAHHLYETFFAQRDGQPPVGDAKTPLQKIGDNVGNELSNRLAEGIGMYAQDLENIKAGRYSLPWDMVTPTHRQYNPLYALSNTALFVGEAINTLRKRVRSSDDVRTWLDSKLYPDYYLNSFHYQTDGWLSSRSAAVYEFSTETLFFGRQDSMQRTCLLPIADYMAAKDPRNVTILEVACGTGRFHTFIKDNWPTAPSIASDLSPYYLQRARENVKYWKRCRQESTDLGGTDRTGVRFLQCQAEAIDLPDNSVDVVACVYLFHELPEDVRAKVAAEMFRVLRPGGIVSFTDSVQLGDRPDWDSNLGMFGNLNEPFYRNYIACDLGALFQDAGFACGTKYVASASKTLSFVKPAAKAAEPAPESSGGGSGSGNGAPLYN